MTEISLIVAASENDVIGLPGRMLPWRLTSDLRHFREITTGHPVIMGRKTYDTIGRPLPNRQNIIVTRNPDFKADGIQVVSSLAEALKLAQSFDDKEFFIGGGGSLYEQAMPFATKLYLTRVHAEVSGSVYFRMPESEWALVSRQDHESDNENEHPFSWEVYKRRK
jgi:dihydrofolate reductase